MALYLTFQGKKHIITVPAVTLRNHTTMLEWSRKLDAKAKADRTDVQLGAIKQVLDTFPDALDFIDALGNVNAAKLTARMDTIRADEQRKAADAAEAGNTYEPMSEDAIREEAYKWVMDAWQSWIRDNPQAAMMLMFQATEYPTDIEALLLGIDCIKATAGATGETATLIASETTSDFWQDISAEEVAAYCTQFLKAYKAK